jgi:hypothetical protein
MLRAEADRIKDIRTKAGEDEAGPLLPLVWALNVAAAWLDSLAAPDRQTRYVPAATVKVVPAEWEDARLVLPASGDWVLHTYAGVRAPEYGLFANGRFCRGSGPESFPTTHWLPVPHIADKAATENTKCSSLCHPDEKCVVSDDGACLASSREGARRE